MTAIHYEDRRDALVVRDLIAFLIGAFTPVILVASVVSERGGLGAHPLALPLCMLAPMVSAIAVQKARGGRLFGTTGPGIRLGNFKWWMIAPAFAASFVVLSMLASFAIAPNLVSDHAELLRNLQHLNVPHGVPPMTAIAVAVTATIFVGPIINLPIFLGEEIGWRGFMNPRLKRIFGRRGLIVGGTIWAIWHLPMILLGHNYPDHPWTGFLVWIPICICMNILLDQVAEKSGSVVPCALAHGMMNQLATLALSLTVQNTAFVDILHGPAGLVGLAVLLAPAAWLYIGAGRAFNESFATVKEADTRGDERVAATTRVARPL